MSRKIAGLLMLTAVVCTGIATHPTEAHGAIIGNTYVCKVYYNPSQTDPSKGSVGFVWAEFWSLPNCAGTKEGSGFFYSDGATDPAVVSEKWLYPDVMLGSLYQNLFRAMESGTRVYVGNSSTTNQLYYIQFSGN